MTKGSYEYYEDQINKVDPDAIGVKVKLMGEHGETHWLAINDSSAEVIINYLNRFLAGLN